ncbi:hypothetical protein VTL71DRAFT_3457 [Oculimacula yallundae]|uniref:FAD-binding FR-type domain-containing protein n=1 Tax=Oculimacula yallundae TaxID=86028 RepID=A0ABR4C807_9HELO
MRLLILSIFFLSWTDTASASAWGWGREPEDFCFGGCDLALSSFEFEEKSWELKSVSESERETRLDTASRPDQHSDSDLDSESGLGAVRKRIQTRAWPSQIQKCTNAYRIPSLYLCLQMHCTEEQRIEGLKEMNETCKNKEKGGGVVLPSFEGVIGRYGEEEKGRLRWLGRSDLENGEQGKEKEKEVLREVVLLSEDVRGLGRDTLAAANFEMRIHNVYGCAMYFFWAVIIAIGLSSHLGQYVLSSRTHNSHHKWQALPSDDNHDSEIQPLSSNRSIFDTPYILLKRYVTVPATFGYKRSQNVGWCTIPTRVQSMAIAAFVVINVVLCSCSYWTFEGNMYWLKPSAQFLRYFADRTGIISTANLPLIWIFGIRNNTLLWLTGWDFAAYNMFHRWVARVATVQAVAHSVAYTVLIFGGDMSWSAAWTYYLTYYERRYFWNGVLATIFMVAVLVVSVYPLRRNFYEIFLWLHIILSVLVLITMYYHVIPFSHYAMYVYPCISIWLFDRLLRILRILSFNPKFWSTHATITYSAESNIVRMTVPYSTAWTKPRPGGFYYVYFLSSRGWENHPFTLAYSTPLGNGSGNRNMNGIHSPSVSLGTISPPVRAGTPANIDSVWSPSSPGRTLESESLLPSQLESSSTSYAPSNAPPSTLTFLVRPYAGFTSRLRAEALRSGAGKPSKHRILIEGPYGETQPLREYTNVLFVVGGTGIAVPLSYLRGLVDGEGRKEVRTRKVGIVWAVREEVFLDEVLERDMSTVLGGVEGEMGRKIDIRAFVTRSEREDKDPEVELDDDFESNNDCETQDDFQGESSDLKSKSQTRRKHVEVLQGRPDIFEEVENAVRDAGDETLAVVACGPGMMADDARRAVVRLLGRGGARGRGRGRIEYFEESFNW